MPRNFNERGLDELALSMALGLEPEDPPKGMGDRLFSKIEAESAQPAVAKSGSGAVGAWAKISSVACAALLVLYGTSLYENQQLSQQLKKKLNRPQIASTAEVNKLGELGVSLGEVVRTFPLTSPLTPNGKNAASGKVFVVRSSEGTRIVLLGNRITKEDNSDVVEVWVKEGRKVRPAGATEPMEDGSTTFAASVGKNIDGVSVTLEKQYNTSPEGKTLLASSSGLQPNDNSHSTYGHPNGTDVANAANATNAANTTNATNAVNNRGQSNPVSPVLVREPMRNEEGGTTPQGDHQNNNNGDGSDGKTGGDGASGNNSNNNGGNGYNGNPPKPQPKPNDKSYHLVEIGLIPGVHVGIGGKDVNIGVNKRGL